MRKAVRRGLHSSTQVSLGLLQDKASPPGTCSPRDRGGRLAARLPRALCRRGTGLPGAAGEPPANGFVGKVTGNATPARNKYRLYCTCCAKHCCQPPASAKPARRGEASGEPAGLRAGHGETRGPRQRVPRAGPTRLPTENHLLGGNACSRCLAAHPTRCQPLRSPTSMMPAAPGAHRRNPERWHNKQSLLPYE